MAPPTRPPYARGFASDAETERALRAGLEGRDVNIRRGNLAAALRALTAEPASRLVFVDLDGVADPATAARQLNEVCALQTALIAIGSIDTAQFSRALLQRGIADYLVKPVSPGAVRQASMSVTDDAPEHPYAGRVVAFAGSPGSGTSTLVAAIARGVAADGRLASVVDLDMVCGKLSPMLSVQPGDGLPEFFASIEADESPDTGPAAGTDLLEVVSVPAGPGISLVAYPPTGSVAQPPPLPALLTVLKHLANRTHVVLVTGVSDPSAQVEILRQADSRVLIYEPTLPSITAAVRRLAWLGTDHEAILVECLPRMRRYTLSPAHIRYALAERRPDVVIPFEPALHAGSTGKAPGRIGKGYRKALDRAMELVGRSHGA